MTRLVAAVGRRLVGAVAMLAVVSALLFAAVELLPGDLATQILGPNATAEKVVALRADLDLDDPAPVRYARWLGGVVRGDLGQAAITERSVADTVSGRLGNSAVLAGVAFLAASAMAIMAGVLAGRRPGSRVDDGISLGALVSVSLPEFVVAGLLISVFAFGLGWLPAVSLLPAGVSPLDRPVLLVLPAVSLALVGGAFGARLIRSAVADAGRLPHVEAARLAGIREWQVLRHHVLPGVAGPIAQVLAFLVPYMVGGTVVVERVFSFPGIGSLLVEQVVLRDAPVVEAIGLVLAAAVITAFLTADLVAALADPRRRRGSGAVT